VSVSEVVAKLVIDGQLPGLNDYVDACRSYAYAGARMKTKTENIIGWEIKRQKLMPVYSAVSVHFHWFEPNRRRDMDNIAFAKKFILDALQANGILQGDGWRQIRGLSDAFSVDKNRPRVEVTVTREEDEIRGFQEKLIG
jgi:Holliday junction resolvase RusA-like endonuclease